MRVIAGAFAVFFAVVAALVVLGFGRRGVRETTVDTIAPAPEPPREATFEAAWRRVAVEGAPTASTPVWSLRRDVGGAIVADRVANVRGAPTVPPPDEDLRRQALARIAARRPVGVAALAVTARDGVVVLEGRAESPDEAGTIAAAAASVPGVRRVVSRLRFPSGEPPPGADIRLR